ncbi:restriction endonuclease subunit S [Mycolicibacterium sp. Dal123E01]|uniref:restriction endonuclease subunit S n=1 Tax=Mycolicibacterium sp. Dal123E01 TaxID=3457578 RepID=UPI00403EB758
MSWPAYPEYKESGVGWLGVMPIHWTALGLRHLLAQPISDGPHETPEFIDDGIPFLSVDGIQEGELVFENCRYISEDDHARFSKKAKPQLGDVLMGKAASTGKIAQVKVDTEFNVWSPLAILRPNLQTCTSSFMEYFLKSNGAQFEIDGLCTNNTQKNISMADIPRVSVFLPPLDEQRSITRFLDRETSNIDALIAKQEQFIATLREDRTATITHVVTEGLDPAVDLVQPHNSGLPICPKHWTEQISLKRLAEVQTGLTLGKSVDPVEAVEVPYLRVANVQTSGVNLDVVKTVAVHRSEVSRYLLRDGDVLMTEGGDIDKLGRGCVWSDEVSPCIHQNHVFAVRCNDTLSSAFLVYLLDTAVARNYFFMTAKKTTNLASTNSTTLGAFTFSLPPRSEQDDIVRHLNDRCIALDGLIAKANAVIAILREYRSALITDAVTGKIDVRGAA